MNNRKYKSNPQQLLEEGREVMKMLSSDSNDLKYSIRVFAVNMVLLGCSADDVAGSSGVTRATVTRWVKSVDENGFESLRAKKQTGRPPKLTDSQREVIDSALNSDPADYGLKIWDGPSLSSYIKDNYGIDISIRQCQRLFHALGYSLIRPQPYPSKDSEDTLERDKFKKRIHELEHDDSVVVVYQDEVSFQKQTTSTATWCKKGSAPKVKSFPGRSRVSYSGFINPETGALYVTSPDKFNYETTIVAISSLLKDCPPPKGKRYFMIMDNAPWHKKAKRLIDSCPDYTDISDQMEILMLPPYSPDLNPIEQVWRITRRENTHNVFFSTISKLKETLDKAFSDWSRPNAQLRSLCSFK